MLCREAPCTGCRMNLAEPDREEVCVLDGNPGSPARKFGFFLVPDFTLTGLTSAIEPLRLANRKLQHTAYEWTIISRDGEPVRSSSGVSIGADRSIDDTDAAPVLFVCGGLHTHTYDDKKVLAWLRQLARHGGAVGSICTGSYLLARTGLLDGYRCTIHWENLQGFREDFPEINAVEDIFVVDRNRYTCAGGLAALDMMMHFIIADHGPEVATWVSEEMVYERIRSQSDQQRMALRMRLSASQPKLLACIELMEDNIETPLNQWELAQEIGISVRQLERLFHKYLGCTPSRYYLEMRLNRARALLQQTFMSVMNVALATGFVSASHFSKSYREFFGHSPREEKRVIA